MKQIEVKHEVQPEHEVFINADYMCDLCQTSYPENMVQSVGDAVVCDYCYDHFD